MEGKGDTAFAPTLDSGSGAAGTWPGHLGPGERFDGAGRYVLERAIGAGGMGAAWLARDTLLLRPCVIKVLHGAAHQDATRVERFLREARLTARLRHPHVVATYDLGTTDAGVPFLVLEQLEGQPLDAVLRDASRLSVLRTVAIGLQVLRALEAAHTASVVHHDIKPANVFVTADGTVKLLDFGIAAFAGGVARDDEAPLVDAEASTAGTPNYMAPEQWRGERGDARSDLWAVGALLFELLTGELAFSADTPVAIAAAVLSAEPSYPGPSPEPGHAALFDVIRGALVKELDGRTPDAATMRGALEALWTSLTAGMSAPPKERSGGAMPEPLRDEDVQFTVYAPPLRVGHWEKLLAFAHRAIDDGEDVAYDDPVARVAEEAREVLGERVAEYTTSEGTSAMQIPREHELTFVPRAPTVRFDPPARTFRWTDPVHRELFLARADASVEEEARIEVYLGALLLAEVRFELAVRDAAPPPARARPFEEVFVAFAEADTAIATQLTALTSALSGTRFVQADPTERRTQTLGEASKSAIERADAVQVLWSRAALGSTLVDASIRHAITRRGVERVRPVCWEQPPPIDEAQDRPPRALRERGLSPIGAPAQTLLALISGGGGAAAPPMAAPALPPAGAAPPMSAPMAPPVAGAAPAPTPMAPPAGEPPISYAGPPPEMRAAEAKSSGGSVMWLLVAALLLVGVAVGLWLVLSA